MRYREEAAERRAIDGGDRSTGSGALSPPGPALLAVSPRLAQAPHRARSGAVTESSRDGTVLSGEGPASRAARSRPAAPGP